MDLIKNFLIILRNAIELLLIAIDIAYSKESLKIWINSESENIEKNGDWHFKAKKIYNRINIDEENKTYPEWERNMVIKGYENKYTGLYAEWERLSNTNVHAHSKAQLFNLHDSNGNLYVFQNMKLGEYKIDFYQLRIQIMIVISIMLFVPRYFNKLADREDLFEQKSDVINRFIKIQEEMKIK